MIKKIKTTITLQLKAGEATASPPVGPALGQHGLPIMEFIKAYNEKTKDQKGQIIPAVITVYEDRTFSFITKLPPVAELIKNAMKIEKGSGKPGTVTAGQITMDQCREIAKTKLKDLNTENVEQAAKIIAGSARSMGIQVVN